MRVVIVWKRESDYGRTVEEWIRDFAVIAGREVETVDPDSIDGEIFVRAYDIVEYPTILGLDDSGKVLDSWRGLPLPRMNEVSYYAKHRQN